MREQERQSKVHSEQPNFLCPPEKLKRQKLVLSVRKCLFFWTPQGEKKECSQDQVFNENSVPKGSKMGETSTQSQWQFSMFLHKDEKKSMTILSNTSMVTVTQDDSKMQSGSNMHTWLKLVFFLNPKIRSVIKRMILFNTSILPTCLSYLICFKFASI